ncbi:hypothetical protein A6M27_04965 [Acidithiobacillus thiooxidans]|nr:hypothetical protein A6O24_05935 [Acidithiobacillus thiooxidans]OCX85804.1 hypothetical protein A6O26_00235 [Acidithiobacillus thiooxidans]OCX88918.1 hypothetical protein A6M27_04965 [Acidithiobacillus thiooxidans]OFC48537.1 hypothetical protein BAE47_07545 [Acidithiobacillus thiooxidans]
MKAILGMHKKGLFFLKTLAHLFWWPVDACIGQEIGRYPWSAWRDPVLKDGISGTPTVVEHSEPV